MQSLDGSWRKCRSSGWSNMWYSQLLLPQRAVTFSMEGSRYRPSSKVTTNQRRKQAPTPNLTHTHNLQDCCCVSGPFWNMLVQFSTVHYQLTWTTIWKVYKDVLALFTLPCLTLKPSAHQDYLHYLREEKKSLWNSSPRSLQIRNTNYIHFCQMRTYLLTALQPKTI